MKTLFLFWTIAIATLGYGSDNGYVNAHAGESKSEDKPKNIILFMTDDQDLTANSTHPHYMPSLHNLFREGGMEFPNYYVSTGLCCPSRATILRGQYCHNTGILDNGDFNNKTYQSGGWSKFLDTGLEDETIATLLSQAGYQTGMVGKYMNGYDLYTKRDPGHHKPPGWDHWMGLLKCFNFYGPIFSDNGERILRTNDTVYQTDFIRDWALDFLKNRDPTRPFFLMVTPFAPHAPAIPATRHKDLYADERFPRTEAFNPPDDLQQQKTAWIKNLPGLLPDQIDAMDTFYRNRLRSLKAVDEALQAIADTLDELGLTDETHFIYTADNGQHFGDHRIPAGKRQAYETDVNVPFFVRGPGIPKGTSSPQVVQSVDLGPTFLDVASSSSSSSSSAETLKAPLLRSSYPMDGQSFLPLLTNQRSDDDTSASNNQKNSNNINAKSYNDFRWAALLEMYSGSSNIGTRYKDMKEYHQNHMYPNTYQAVRVIDGPSELTQNANLLYAEWCTGEQELYNMTVDPHQVHNLLATPTPDPSLLPLVHFLSQVLQQLGDCEGADCIVNDDYERFHSAAATTIDPNYDVYASRALFESMPTSIRSRIPCHNPPGFPNASSSSNLRRRPFAYDLPVPEPFQHGFPFSDGEIVEEDLLEVWEAYEHYFY